MFKLVFVTSLLILSATAQNKLAPTWGTKQDHAFTAKSDAGDSAITAREMLVDVTYIDGRPRKGGLAIYYDPDSGRYMWSFAALPKTETTAGMTSGYGITGFLYKDRSKLISFSWYLTTLSIHESTARANGIDDAEAKALAEATAQLPAKLAHRMDDRTILDTAKLFPRDFTLACPTCSGPARMRVLDVIHKGNTWEISIQGQWKEKIILNDKYEISGTARLD